MHLLAEFLPNLTIACQLLPPTGLPSVEKIFESVDLRRCLVSFSVSSSCALRGRHASIARTSRFAYTWVRSPHSEPRFVWVRFTPRGFSATFHGVRCYWWFDEPARDGRRGAATH